MALLFANNASTVLAQGISATDTSLEVSPSTGAAFPAPTDAGDYYLSTIVGADASLEIIKVTARDQDTFTIERAQEGTTAKAFAAGSTIENRLTAGSLKNLLNVTYASEEEVLEGTEANKAISPKTLKNTYNIGEESHPNGIPLADSAGKIDPSWLPYGLATTLTPGMVERATNQEVEDGTDTERYVTPAQLKSNVSDRFSTDSGAGKSPVAGSNGKFSYEWIDESTGPATRHIVTYIKTSDMVWRVPQTGYYWVTLVGGGGNGGYRTDYKRGAGGGGAGAIIHKEVYLTKDEILTFIIGGPTGVTRMIFPDGTSIDAAAGGNGSGDSPSGCFGGSGSSGGGAALYENNYGAGGGSGGGAGGSTSTYGAGAAGGAGAGGGNAGASAFDDNAYVPGGAYVGYMDPRSDLLRGNHPSRAPYLAFGAGSGSVHKGDAYRGCGYGAGGGGQGGSECGGGGGAGGLVGDGDGVFNTAVVTTAGHQGIVILDYIQEYLQYADS